MDLQSILTATLILLGAGFLVANARILFDYVRFLRRRRAALLTWQGRRPNRVMTLALGVVLGFLVCYKLIALGRPPHQVFGESMMFFYYAFLMPLSRTISRGFYEEGIWADSAFIPYKAVGGISWREGEREMTLIVISRSRNLARRLVVPLENYGAARRLLRDRIARHDIHFTGTGLSLYGHDERDEV